MSTTSTSTSTSTSTTPPPLETFTDGFEDGTLNAWDDFIGSVTDVDSHSGSRSFMSKMHSESWVSNSVEFNNIYLSTWIYITELPEINYNLSIMGFYGEGEGGAVEVGIFNIGGDHRLYVYDSNDFIYSDTISLLVNNWYRLYIHIFWDDGWFIDTKVGNLITMTAEAIHPTCDYFTSYGLEASFKNYMT